MATKLQQMTAQHDEIVALLDKRGVPLTDKGLAHRIEMVLDAKGDVEADLSFANARPEVTVLNRITELLDEADIDGSDPYARVASLLEHEQDFLTLADADQSEAIALSHGNILPLMVGSVLDRVRKLAVPYKSLSEFQQGELINSISRVIEVQFAAAIRILAAGDHPIVRAQLVDFTGKGTELKIKLTATKTIENLTSLAKAGDQILDIVFIDQSAVNNGATAMPQADVEQPPLPLDAAADKVSAQRDAQLARDLPNESEMLADEQPIVSGDPDAGASFDGAPGWGEGLDPDDIEPLTSQDDDDEDDLDQSTTADDVDQTQENEVAR